MRCDDLLRCDVLLSEAFEVVGRRQPPLCAIAWGDSLDGERSDLARAGCCSA